MKTFIRFAIAGALAVGAQVAGAQTVPGSGTADAYLFVYDASAGVTFAEDLGSAAALNTLMPAGSLSAGSTLSTAINDSINIQGSSTLQTFISQYGASNLQWAVLGVQYNTSNPGKQQGQQLLVQTNNQNPQLTAGFAYTNMNNTKNGFNNDVINYLIPGVAGSQPGLAAGGTVFTISTGSVGGAVFGFSAGNSGGSTNLYGQGISQLGVGIGQSVELYGLTANGTGVAESYQLADLTLSANGTLSSATAPVPVPAAAWLFGSGLLGLAGIRRRAAAAT